MAHAAYQFCVKAISPVYSHCVHLTPLLPFSVIKLLQRGHGVWTGLSHNANLHAG
jgi:hypothetical protein